MNKTEELAQLYEGDIINLREKLHQYPEESFKEFKTSEIIKDELDKLNISYKTYLNTGICALINGKQDGKTVLLRADIDALPIKEENDISFKSKNDGYMHACGHDVHIACLIGAAKILNELKDDIKGNIKLIFQPAEETTGGAKPMIDEGIMENPDVDAAFALHVEPLEKVGNIQIKDGPIMACPDEFDIEIEGVGGHGSAPHQCISPILIASRIIQEFQNKLDSQEKTHDKAIFSVCAVNSGNCHNVIPSTAKIMGTLRAFDNEIRFNLAEELKKISAEITESMGGKCIFKYNPLYPPVINDTNMNKIVSAAAENIPSIKEIKILDKPFMAGDDFSYFSELVPSSYFRLGVGNDDISYPIHHPKFNIDNQSLAIGSSLLAEIAIEYLES